jgi:kynurenine 3-monooxygenase
MKNLIKVGLRNLLFRIFAVQIFTKVFMQTPQKIAVVGSGLVGTLLAIYFKKIRTYSSCFRSKSRYSNG